MALYYVRKTGSDAAAGTSAGTAWLTVDKAANTVAAGDTVYIGAGVYRELVTMDASGTSGNQISFIADIDGSKTGDAGLVIVSAFDTDTATSTRVNCLDMNGKEFITWQDINFDGGSTAVVVCATAGHDSYEGVIFDGCVVLAQTGTASTIYFDLNQATTPATSGPIFRNCAINGTLVFNYDENSSADNNIKAVVENCIFTGFGRSTTNTQAAIRLAAIGTTGTFAANGIDVNNCTFSGYENGILVYGVHNVTSPLNVANNLFIGCQIGVYRFLGTSGAVVSLGYNFATNCATPFQGVANVAGDDFSGSHSMLGGLADLPLYRRLGWSPFKPWEPISMSGYASPLIDAGSATYAPAADIYGNARPMGTADDVGAVESNPRGARSATWAADASTYSMAFTSIGYYESMIPVDAVSTTVTVKAYKDASYAGTAPKLEVFIGDTSQGTDSMVVANEVEETLSVNFTPSAAGWARVRLYSYATAGSCFFDSMAVA